MDFRKCPACEASVLEDDAADCPFCGASMSGKPASRTPVTKPTEKAVAKQPPGTAAAGKQLPARSAVAKKPEADDADPFDVDTSLVAQAPPMAPRPAKGRMIRVVCPMCETPGFITPKMQGRDVKCCNPDCLVPVFKAPRPEKKAEPEEEATGLVSAKTVLLGSAVVIPLTALIVWLAVRDTGPEPFQPGQRTTSTDPDALDPQPADQEDKPPEKIPARAKISLAEIQRRALSLSVEAALQRDENRSKPYCRRLAAEAYAQVGNLDEARTQLDRLRDLRTEPFYRIEPLVEIAWQQLAAGDRSAAEKTINEALASAQDFPPVGRPAATAVSSLAAALAAVGRIDDAKEVLRRLGRDDDKAVFRERVAALVQITFDLEIFDLDQVLRYSSLDMARAPLAVATAVSLAAHQQWNQAIAWALAVEDVASREDCLSALAVVVARQPALTGEKSPVNAVTEAGKQVSLTGQARVAAGAATGHLMRDDREAATAALSEASTLLARVARPQPIPKPTVRLIHDSADDRTKDFPDPAPLRSAAVAAAQMARLHYLLGDNQAAWTTLLKAWEFTQGIGPQLSATATLVDEIANNSTQAERRLRRELGIANQDLGDRALRKYRRQARVWGDAADRRFELEVSLLQEALTWGLLDNVAEVVADPPAVIPSAVGQSYALSYLATALKELYAAAGDDTKSRDMAALETRDSATSDRTARLIAKTEQLFQQKKYIDAAQLLGESSGFQHTEQMRDLRGMQLACRMLKLNRPDLYFPFILALHDPVLMDDSFEMTAALAVQEGQAAELWERYRTQGLTSTQRVAFFRGLIAGIVAMRTSSPTAGAQTAAAPAPGDRSD